MTLIVLPAAEWEAADAAIWYDEQKHGLGDEFLAEFKGVLDHIRDFPEQSARLEGYTGREVIRRSLMKRFPYAIVFVRRPAGIVVIAVSHVRRRPFYWLERLRLN
jgi:hypothetical protein